MTTSRLCHRSRSSTDRLVGTTGLLLSHVLVIAPLIPRCVGAEAPAAEVDLRPAFKQWGFEPRLQGGRGTCSVFTVAGALEYALARKTGERPLLSVEFLNWASNQVAGRMQDGSFFSDLWRGFSVHGVCPESDMPYRDRFDPTLTPSDRAKENARRLLQEGLRLHWIKEWDPNTGLTEEQLAVIKEVLGRRWPVCGGFRWPKNVQWNEEVLAMAPPEGVFDGHSVLIVGYRDDPAQAGGGVLIFRNSNSDGRDGHMTYEYARAYMNDAAWIDCEADHPKPSLSMASADEVSPLPFLTQGCDCIYPVIRGWARLFTLLWPAEWMWPVGKQAGAGRAKGGTITGD